jgi:hypothetical protein
MGLITSMPMYDWPERHAEVDVGWAATGTSPRLRAGDHAALVEYDPACRSAPRSWCGKSALGPA